MNTQKHIVCLIALIGATHLYGDHAVSKIVPRSQSFNAARQIVGWNNPEWGINRMPQEDSYTSFNLIFEYTRTFRNKALTECLFGDDLICTCDNDLGIKISGSAVATRDHEHDWLADYFGLPRDFESTVSFNPTISNFILDFSFYAGLNGWVDGAYFRIHAPFVHTKWNLNATECVATAGSIGYFQGYFSSAVVPVENLNKSFLAYANGCSVPTINNNYADYLEYECLAGLPPFSPDQCTPLGTITWQPLCCSKINNDCDCNGLSRNGFGEIRFVLGYNFANDPEGDYHLGAGLYVAAPTGTRVGSDDCDGKGRYLFEPVVGNGKHWELGGQVTAHHIWWRSEDADKSFGFYLEANVTHLFKACQTRCFDLCSAGSNSRYMLAQRLQNNRNSFPRTGSEDNPLELEFGNEYAPVANLTRRNVSSSIGAQGDVAITLSYQSCNFQWDVGYDFWGRSCEKLSIQNECCISPLGDWALKGDQRVYGFGDFSGGLIAAKINVTDSGANIHAGSNMINGVSYAGINPTAPRNFYADDSIEGPGTLLILPDLTAPTLYITPRPVMIQESDIDLNSTRGISNKFFTHLNWAWANREDTKWTPYVGIGAEVEFGSNHDKSCCETDCNNYYTGTCADVEKCCSNCALSQWGIWFKVGSSYN